MGKNQNIVSLPRSGNCEQTQTIPQENHGQTMLKMSIISDLKRAMARQKKTSQCNMMMKRTVNENAVCHVGSVNRSDQPKIDIIADNDARLILRKNALRGNDMIESNLKAKNYNRGQLFTFRQSSVNHKS